jgi:L-threonylcarbamoyladenylate synthase
MDKIGQDIGLAARILAEGGLVGIPTETVYGLAANAFNPESVVKIFEAKNRPFFDPLIVHTHSLEAAAGFVNDIPDRARKLFDAFAPGPITILLERNKEKIPDIVTSGLDTVAVRIPDHPLTLNLLQELDFPLAAPSANPFGYVSPTTAQHVQQHLGNEVDYILDGGPSFVGLESTIVGFEEGKTIIYRLGGLSVEDIEGVAGRVELAINASSDPRAPGQLKSHYAPGKKLYIEGTEPAGLDYNKAAFIGFDILNDKVREDNQLLLSKTGNINEAAQKLFAALRKTDNLDVEVVIAAKFPNTGLGLAINDRLKRAAG